MNRKCIQNNNKKENLIGIFRTHQTVKSSLRVSPPLLHNYTQPHTHLLRMEKLKFIIEKAKLIKKLFHVKKIPIKLCTKNEKFSHTI